MSGQTKAGVWALAGALALSTGFGIEVIAQDPELSLFHQDVSWSPDGTRLAFSQLPTEGEYNAEKWSIFTIAVDGGEPELVSAAARTVSWSPDGERLAFAALRDGNWEILTSDSDGTDERRLTENDGTDGAPAWSPDGETIAFHSDRGGTFKVYTMDDQGGHLTQLTSGEGGDNTPYWSPDGESIVFYRGLGDGADQVWTVNMKGEETRVTHDDHNNIFPAFRPDGRIVFASKPPEGTSTLVQVGSDGSDRQEIPEIETFYARYSPDGKWIAFIKGRWPRSAIYIATSEGREIRKLVN